MPDLSSVGVIVLAAGSSRRLGRPKQLLDLEGKPLLQHAIDATEDAGVGEVVVVLGHMADDVAAAITLAGNARVMVNRDHATGQASSLRVGIGALGSAIDRAVVLLGDQPRIAVEAIRAVAVGPGPIRRVRYPEGLGHPVAFDRELWGALLEIEGDQGARELIAAHPDLMHEIPFDAALPKDVDTDADAAEVGISS